jgi:hypothetical protein
MTGLTVAAAAMQILNNALGAMKSAKERAKGSKDTELKEEISTLYDVLLDLKEALMRLADENTELRRKLEQLETAQKEKPELRQVGVVNYYFDGDKGPYCQACYDGKLRRLVALSPPEDWNGGIRRYCPVHEDHIYEKEMVVGGMRLGGRRG